MNPVALHWALNYASAALAHAEAGSERKAREAYVEASLAAVSAFPSGTPEAAALTLVLSAVGEAARSVTV